MDIRYSCNQRDFKRYTTEEIRDEFLITDLYVPDQVVSVYSHYKNKPEDIRYIYDGHEVAAHSLTHPFLPDLPDDEIIRQVEQDRLNLSELADYEVCGFAYPCSSPKNDPRTIEIVRQKTGVRYARTVETTMSFAPQKDLYFVQGSIYHHFMIAR